MTGIWTVYSAAGEIRRSLTVSGDPELLAANLDDGEAVIAGEHSGATHYVRDGRPVPFPPRPDDYHIFDFAREVWHDPRSAAERAADLEAARARAAREISRIRGAARARYITITPGQELVYLDKAREARDWLAATSLHAAGGPAPDIAEFPALAAESGPGLTAETPDQLAQIILNLADHWRHASALIERITARWLRRLSETTDANAAGAMPAEYAQDLEAALAALQNPGK